MESKKNVAKPLIKEFWEYIKRPILDVEDSTPWYIKVFNMIRLWSVGFGFSLFAVLIASVLLDWVGYNQEEFALNELVEEIPYYLIIFFVVIWAPITEELAFRLGLKFSPWRWGIGISVFVFFIFSFLGFSLDLIVSILLLISVAVFTGGILCIKSIGSFVNRVFKQYYRFFFYTFAIVFAFLHITNYRDDWISLWYLSPMLVMPQLILSFIASFIRMQYGFLWAVLTHALNNGVVIAVVLFFLPFADSEATFALNNVETMDLLSAIAGLWLFLGVLLLSLLSAVSFVWELITD